MCVRGAEPPPRSQQRRETATHLRDAPRWAHSSCRSFRPARKNPSLAPGEEKVQSTETWLHLRPRLQAEPRAYMDGNEGHLRSSPPVVLSAGSLPPVVCALSSPPLLNTCISPSLSPSLFLSASLFLSLLLSPSLPPHREARP